MTHFPEEMTHNDFVMKNDVLDVIAKFLNELGIKYLDTNIYKKNFVDFNLKGWEQDYMEPVLFPPVF